MKFTTKRTGLVAVAAVSALALSACGGGSGFSNNTGSSASPAASATKEKLTVLIGSSGQAETDSVKAAVAAWSAKSGTPAEVQVANDLGQQIAQGFAAGSPADIMYVGDQLATYAKAGNLLAYGDQVKNKDDFYPALVKAFTYKDKFYCAPKDFSTLALVINTDMWAKAGLTDADVPTTWEQLAAVAKQVAPQGSKKVGLAVGPEVQRLGVFMGQAGGGLLSADGKAQANNPANVEALTYVKGLLNDGSAALTSDLGAGWGGEAFGKGMAAMTIEGNWITGALSKDYKDVKWKAVELPAGKNKSTLSYTNCWAIAAKSKNTGGAIDLVNFLTSTEQQLKFAKDFGVMPSIKSAAAQWKTDNPTMVPFLNGADYSQTLPNQPGTDAVIKDLNSKIAQLKTGDPKAILDATQTNLDAALAG